MIYYIKMYILAVLAFILINFSLLYSVKKINTDNKDILYNISSKNISNIFIICVSSASLIKIIIDLYELYIFGDVEINIKIILIFVNIIFHIFLLIITILLICSKSRIYIDKIVLCDGIFKIEDIKSVEKK